MFHTKLHNTACELVRSIFRILSRRHVYLNFILVSKSLGFKTLEGKNLSSDPANPSQDEERQCRAMKKNVIIWKLFFIYKVKYLTFNLAFLWNC